MDSFEFLFTLFGLMLGLALTEVVGGFAKAVKRRGAVRLGVLTPLLALFFAYEITDFWMYAWDLRAAIPIGTPALIGSLLVTGLYYFAAVLVWPEDGDAGWDDLDGWMLEHKRVALLSVFGSGILAMIGDILLAPQSLPTGVFALSWIGLYLGLILLGAFAPGRRTTIAALALLLGMHVVVLGVSIAGA